MRLPRLTADTANAVIISAIIVVNVAVVTVEDPRVVTIVRVDRRGPPTGVSLFYSLEEAKRSLGSSIRHLLANFIHYYKFSRDSRGSLVHTFEIRKPQNSGLN